MKAFDVELDQIAGPSWIMENMGPNLYQVDATMPAETTKVQYQLMMQDLVPQLKRARCENCWKLKPMRLLQIQSWIKKKAVQRNLEKNVMLFDSVPCHHVFKNLQANKTSTSTRSGGGA